MATPARQLILDDVATVLATITTGNGYKTDVSTVSRALKSWEDVGVPQMPYVAFAPIGTSLPQYKPNKLVHVELPLTVIAHVNARSGATKTTALAALEDDIIAALNADTTRDNNAIRTNWQGTQTDEGNQDSDDHRGGSGTLVMTFQILYQRTVNSS